MMMDENNNSSHEDVMEEGMMVVVRRVTNKKKKKATTMTPKSFAIGSLFTVPIVCMTTTTTIQTNNNTATSPTIIEVPSNCLLTLTTACTNKPANVRLYVCSNDNDNEFVCIGTLTKQKAMTNIGIQVTSTSIQVKAEQYHTTRNSDSSTTPLTVNLFGIIQPSSIHQPNKYHIQTNHNMITTTKSSTSSTDTPKKETVTTQTNNTTIVDTNNTKNIIKDDKAPKESKKRKLSIDDINANISQVAMEEKEEDPPIPKLTKKQRKKLAKQKALELELALHGPVSENEEKKDITKATKRNKVSPLTKERRMEGGLLVRDIILGTGSMIVKPGKKVSIHYEGSLADTGKVFDRNQSKSNPLNFRVGTGQVIKGLERGLDGMRAGGERMLTIPPDLGYGKKGSGNVIPKNATLCFTVKLISVGGSGK